jgi:hypothetical protein
MNNFNDEVCEYNYSTPVTENFENAKCMDDCGYRQISARRYGGSFDLEKCHSDCTKNFPN